VNAQEFQKLVEDVKKSFLSHGQVTLKEITDIYIQWQEIRRKLLVLDHSVFEKNINDIEDQLDLMSLSDFVYRKPSDVWIEFLRYFIDLILLFYSLYYNIQSDNSDIFKIDQWM